MNKFCLIISSILLSSAVSVSAQQRTVLNSPLSQAETQYSVITSTEPGQKAYCPPFVRGIHVTAWIAGSMKQREKIDALLNETEINTVVIDLKEYEGEVYIPGVKLAEEYKTYTPAISNLKEYVADLKSRGVYTIARIVVFKDNKMARANNDWAVKNPDGSVWQDRSKNTWLDPYNKHTWKYNLDIAKKAVEYGFEEIQFDYIRFPSDGNTKNCRYSQKHSPASAVAAITGFLHKAREELKPLGVNTSIDVFGLVTTTIGDMGIGQKIIEMTNEVDFVSPMVYPSHYYPGEYNLKDPDLAPYETVYYSLYGAKKRLGTQANKLRPWLQDFSIKSKYKAKEVREQIQACYDNEIGDWILWNPNCRYTKDALKSGEFETSFEKSNRPQPKMRASLKENGVITKDVEVSSGTIKNEVAVSSQTQTVDLSTSTAADLPEAQPASQIETSTDTLK